MFNAKFSVITLAMNVSVDVSQSSGICNSKGAISNKGSFTRKFGKTPSCAAGY